MWQSYSNKEHRMENGATEQKRQTTQAIALTILSIALLSCYHIKHCWQEAIWLYFKRIQDVIVGHNRKYSTTATCSQRDREQTTNSNWVTPPIISVSMASGWYERRNRTEIVIAEVSAATASSQTIHQQPCITTKMTNESAAQNAEAPFGFRSNGLVSAFRRDRRGGGGVRNNTHSPSHNSLKQQKKTRIKRALSHERFSWYAFHCNRRCKCHCWSVICVKIHSMRNKKIFASIFVRRAANIIVHVHTTGARDASVCVCANESWPNWNPTANKVAMDFMGNDFNLAPEYEFMHEPANAWGKYGESWDGGQEHSAAENNNPEA